MVQLIGWPPRVCWNCCANIFKRHIEEKVLIWNDLLDAFVPEKITLKCVVCGAIVQESVET